MGTSGGEARLYLSWCLDLVRGGYAGLLPSIEERVYDRREESAGLVAQRIVLCLLYDLVGNPDRARRAAEVMEKRHGEGRWRRIALPASYLLGRTTEEDLWRDCGAFRLLPDSGSSSVLFYLLGLVQEKRGARRKARALFRYAVEADPLNYWEARLSARRLRR
jgi:hypothetical protein